MRYCAINRCVWRELQQFSAGRLFSRNIQLRMGQAPVVHLMPELFSLIVQQKLDPTQIITHRMKLDDASHAYELFNDREDQCIKVVLKP